jgi:hypothetical protein
VTTIAVKLNVISGSNVGVEKVNGCQSASSPTWRVQVYMEATVLGINDPSQSNLGSHLIIDSSNLNSKCLFIYIILKIDKV